MALHAALFALILGCADPNRFAEPARVQKKDWPKLQHTLKGWSGGLAFSPDGKTLYAGGWDPDQPPPDRFRVPDRTIDSWDVATGKKVTMLKGHKEARTVTLSPDGKLLASAGKGIQIWDVATGKSIRSVEGPRGQVRALAFSPDGKLLASGASFNGGVGSAVGLWEVDTLKSAAAAPEGVRGAQTVAFTPDGKTLAFETADTVRLWDVEAGRERAAIRLEGRYVSIRSVAFSPDGKTLAMGFEVSGPKDPPKGAVPPGPPADAREITFWDTATGKYTGSIVARGKGTLSLAFSPDGRTLASASRAETMELWDVASKKSLATLETKPWIEELAFSPDGKILAAGCNGGFRGEGEHVIEFWNVERGK
jgi:WD40 repeat protein